MEDYVKLLKTSPEGDLLEKAKAANDFSIVLKQIITTRLAEEPDSALGYFNTEEGPQQLKAILAKFKDDEDLKEALACCPGL